MTIIVWLLVSIGNSYTGPSAMTLERFPTSEECNRVRVALEAAHATRLVCLQATVMQR